MRARVAVAVVTLLAALIATASAQPAPSTSPEIDKLTALSRKQESDKSYEAHLASTKKLVVLQRKLSGEDSIYTWRREQDVIGALSHLSRWTDLIEHEKKMLAKAERLHGKDSDEVYRMLGTMVGTYEMARDFAAVEPVFKRLLEISKKTYGERHDMYASDLGRYATFLSSRGEHVAAARLLEQALAIHEANKQNINGDLSALGMSYMLTDIPRAKLTFDKFIARLKTEKPDYQIHMLWWVSGFYRRAGRLDLATPIEKQATDLARAEIARIEKASGKDAKELTSPLFQLGSMLMEVGDLAGAEPLLTRGIAINEKLKGFPPYAQLAMLRRKQGRAKEALALMEKAQATMPGGTGLYSMMGDIYKELGNTKKAEQLYVAAQADMDKDFGKNAVLVLRYHLGLFAVYVAAKQLDKAEAVLADDLAIEERELSFVLASGTETDHLTYFTNHANVLDTTIAFNVQLAPKRDSVSRLAMTTLLRRKGRMLDAAAASLGTLRARLSPDDKRLLDELDGARARLAKVAVQGAKMNPTFAKDVAALSDQIQKLEVTLARKNGELKLVLEPVELAAVQKKLPAAAKLVEIVNYQPGDLASPYSATPKLPPRRYAAYVLGAKGAPSIVDLGEAPPIEDAIAKLRAALSDPDNDNVATVSKALYDLTFGKLRTALGKSTQILIAPDGALNVVPFAALHDGKQYLVQQYTFTYLTSGRDLLRLGARAAAKTKRGSAVIFADPDFDGPKTAQPATRRSRAMQGLHWPRLPGTAQEADALEKSLAGATIYRAKQATEATLKSLHSPRILHLATHGFFLSDADASVENPLLRSGLVFAGANALASGDDDGVVTALEAASLDLRGTGLVVLSACETGVGKITNGEGVYGLRRAFVIAGAESLVMSMWEVDDAATRDLMAGYYKKLEAGAGRSEGLRAIQREMSATKNYAHPYYWASFIAAGDSAPLGK
jgi:CHAT domain-containing protein